MSITIWENLTCTTFQIVGLFVYPIIRTFQDLLLYSYLVSLLQQENSALEFDSFEGDSKNSFLCNRQQTYKYTGLTRVEWRRLKYFYLELRDTILLVIWECGLPRMLALFSIKALELISSLPSRKRSGIQIACIAPLC